MGRAKLLGLDPSTKALGWAYLDLKTGAPILCGAAPIAKIKKERGLSLEAAYAETLGIVKNLAPDVEVVYVERHFVGKSRKVTIILAECVGACLMACEYCWPGIPRNRFVPQEWKKRLDLEHNASKRECQAKATALQWRWEGLEDAADAGCIASAGWLENQKGYYGET